MGRPKKFNRIEVLEKALPLFWERGFANTGLQDLEAATGVNKSGLYSEFEDKEDIFLASLRHYYETARGRELLRVEPLGWDNIEAYLKLRSQPAPNGQMGCFGVNSLRELASLPHAAQKIVTDSRANLRKLFLANITAEKTTMPAESIASLVQSFFSGLCIEQNLKPAKAATMRRIEDFMRMLRTA